MAWVATLALALTLAALSWHLDMGYLALMASGLLAPMGAWMPRSSEAASAGSLRACATAELLCAPGVVAAWSASAFALDQRRLGVRIVMDDQENWGALVQADLARAPMEGLKVPPSFFELAAPATVSCLVAAVIAARVLAPFVHRGDQRARRDLVACAALIALAAGLLIAATWHGAFVDERIARQPALPTP